MRSFLHCLTFLSGMHRRTRMSSSGEYGTNMRFILVFPTLPPHHYIKSQMMERDERCARGCCQLRVGSRVPTINTNMVMEATAVVHRNAVTPWDAAWDPVHLACVWHTYTVTPTQSAADRKNTMYTASRTGNTSSIGCDHMVVVLRSANSTFASATYEPGPLSG